MVQVIPPAGGGGGGGGGATFPMAEGVWYSPFTAIGGSRSYDTDAEVGEDVALSAPIRLFADCIVSRIGIRPTVAPESGTITLRVALHNPSANGAIGAKVADLGTIEVADSYNVGFGAFVATDVSVPISAGFYHAVVSASDTITIGYISYGDPGFAGPTGIDQWGDPAPGVQISSAGIGIAIPSDLSSADQLATWTAPYVLFQITHD